MQGDFLKKQNNFITMETYKELYFQLKSYYFHSEDFENFSKPVKIQTLN